MNIKKEMFGILKEFVNLCNQYDIKYSLHGGTLLGAIREKDFIPWDDDLDITFTRSEFNKFLNIISQNFSNLSLIRNGLSYKIVDIKNYPNTWIDIIIYDYISENKLIQKIKILGISFFRAFTRKPSTLKATKERGKFKGFSFFLIFLSCYFGVLFSEKFKYKLSDKFLLSLSGNKKFINRSNDQYVGMITILPSSYMKKYIKIDFKNIKVMISDEYKNILLTSYGNNYMTPIKYSNDIHSHHNTNLYIKKLSHKNKINILHIIHAPSNSIGGVENFLFERYKLMDLDKFNFDFAFTSKNSMSSISNNTVFKYSSFFELNSYDSINKKMNYLKFIINLFKIYKCNNYDIIHIHSGSPFILAISIWISKFFGLKKILSHNHSATYNNRKQKNIKKIIIDLIIEYICKNSTYLLACSDFAAKSSFNCIKYSYKLIIIKNAIDLNKFSFNKKSRELIIKKYNKKKDIVVGMVGRLSDEKNIFFGLKIFEELLKLNNNFVFWIIGDGTLKNELINYTHYNNIYNKVKFFGERNDVFKLLNGIDFLLFPSKYEGLGISAIEAQATGVTVFASTNVPKETKITPLLYFKSLDENPIKWAKFIYRKLSNIKRRKNYNILISNKGYNIKNNVIILENLYKKIYDL